MVDFLENVASMPLEVQNQYSHWLGSEPIMIEDANCGWVQRKRLLWLTVNKIGVSPSCPPPADWQWVQHEGKPAELRYCGTKPVPAKVHLRASTGLCLTQLKFCRCKVRGQCTHLPGNFITQLLDLVRRTRGSSKILRR